LRRSYQLFQPAALPLAALCLVLTLGSVPAREPIRVSNSRSGQFVLPLVPPRPVNRSAALEKDPRLTPLDFRFLPVSCERVKELLWRELGATAPWRGKIFVTVYAATAADDPITIASERFRDGWQYRVELPDLLERTRFARAIVQVLLLEMANRNAGAHSAEIPGWLTEGLSRQLLASSKVELMLAPPQTSANGLLLTSVHKSQVQENPLAEAHKRLSKEPPLSFQQICWPASEQVTGEAWDVYSCSAQLFVSDLLDLRGGKQCMRAMLAELPQHYNWQLAFFHTFQPYFQNTVDVEKWWALQLVHFTGRELTEAWDAEKGWHKLNQAVRSEVQVRIGTNEMPLHVEAKLQTVLQEWDDTRQLPALRAKLAELGMLRPRLGTNLAPVLDEYCRILNDYLNERAHPGFVLPLRKGTVRRHAEDVAVKQLDAVDERLAALRPAEKRTAPSEPLTPEQAAAIRAALNAADGRAPTNSPPVHNDAGP
jgi:hypothetical protein